MSNYEGRRMDLKNRVNKHIKKLTGIERDYFSNLTQNELLDLKTVLADINNLLTFQMTIAAATWICDYFQMNDTLKLEIIKKVDSAKPNSKGFDIHITAPYKIIAEVKCTVPINNGPIFGVAQHDAILTDIGKLINGKGNLLDTSKYFKFLFIIDLGERTTQAILKLIKETKGTTAIANKFNNIKKDKIEQLSEDSASNSIDTKKVYIKKIKIK